MNNPQLRILVVENERIVALELTERLRRMGHVVCGAAATGNEAIRLAQEAQPSVVLMDIMLDGEMDGIEAAREIRVLLGLPVIFCSAFTTEMQSRADAVEPVAFLQKPLNYVMLAQLLSGLGDASAKEGAC